jgi:hypothetical protein
VTAQPADRTHQKLKRLTAVVWILSAIIVMGVLLAAVQFFSWPNPCASLDGSPEKKIRAASVIALARYEKSGSTLRCVITEILKRAPGTVFYYRVGDEFRHGNTEIRENTDYGDGQILFFVGSPAEHCYSVAFSGDRLRWMGEMPITQLRQIIHDSPQ